MKTLLQKPSLTNEKSLKTWVENRTIYSLEQCELNLFETYEESQRVNLKFNDLVVTSMLRGKKVMHLFDEPGFDYLPGETVLIPSKVEMVIDFPEATFENPTQCLALAIDQQKIQETLDFLNEKYPKEGSQRFWELNADNYFFYNNLALAGTLNKLVTECMSDNITKDALADLTLQELLIRIIQSQTVRAIDTNQLNDPNHPITPILHHIKNHITESFNLKDLSEKACMSTTTFYRFFKRELGVSPLEFILNEKIKYAKNLLKNQKMQINEVCYASGFEDCNYFIRIFKKVEGITPKQYQLLQI
jgi:AraC-like DNA-binding protein